MLEKGVEEIANIIKENGIDDNTKPQIKNILSTLENSIITQSPFEELYFKYKFDDVKRATGLISIDKNGNTIHIFHGYNASSFSQLNINGEKIKYNEYPQYSYFYDRDLNKVIFDAYICDVSTKTLKTKEKYTQGLFVTNNEDIYNLGYNDQTSYKEILKVDLKSETFEKISFNESYYTYNGIQAALLCDNKIYLYIKNNYGKDYLYILDLTTNTIKIIKDYAVKDFEHFFVLNNKIYTRWDDGFYNINIKDDGTIERKMIIKSKYKCNVNNQIVRNVKSSDGTLFTYATNSRPENISAYILRLPIKFIKEA